MSQMKAFYFSKFAYVISLALLLLFLVYELFPLKVFNVKNIILTSPQTLKVGSEVTYKITRCKQYNIPVEISYTLYNDMIYTLPITKVSNAPADCPYYKDAVGGVIIPDYLPAGKYFLRNTTITELPLGKRVVEVYDTAEFEVTK